MRSISAAGSHLAVSYLDYWGKSTESCMVLKVVKVVGLGPGGSKCIGTVMNTYSKCTVVEMLIVKWVQKATQAVVMEVTYFI